MFAFEMQALNPDELIIRLCKSVISEVRYSDQRYEFNLRLREHVLRVREYVFRVRECILKVCECILKVREHVLRVWEYVLIV